MTVKSIECQLAQGQIGRYLRGELLSQEALNQLEAHIADCEDCSQTVVRRRQALQSMLTEKTPARAVVETDKKEPAMETAKARLLAAIRLTEPVPEEPKEERASAPATSAQPEQLGPTGNRWLGHLRSMFPKPVLFGIGLVLVLAIMSYMSRGAVQAFGPSASDYLPNQASAPIRPSAKPASNSITGHPTGAPARGAANTPRTTKAFTPDNPRPTPTDTQPPADLRVNAATHATVTTHRTSLHRSPTTHRASSRRVARHITRAHTIRPAALRQRHIAARRHALINHSAPKRRTGSTSTSQIRVYDADGKPIS